MYTKNKNYEKKHRLFAFIFFAETITFCGLKRLRCSRKTCFADGFYVMMWPTDQNTFNKTFMMMWLGNGRWKENRFVRFTLRAEKNHHHTLNTNLYFSAATLLFLCIKRTKKNIAKFVGESSFFWLKMKRGISIIWPIV